MAYFKPSLEFVEFYVTNYIDAQYQSDRALIRVLLCLLPGLIFLWKRREFPITAMQRSIYSLMSCMAVLYDWLDDFL